MYKAAVNILPIVDRLAIHNLHGNVLEVLLISSLCNFCHDLLLVDVLLERQKNLDWIDQLYEIIGNF